MNILQKFTCFLLIASINVSTVYADPTFAFNHPDDTVTVQIQGEEVVFKDQNPIILVPIRGTFEKLGYNVQWNQQAKVVTISNSAYTVVIKIGESKFTTNGKEHNLDIPALIVKGRTMLPFREILESVNCKVEWDNTRGTIVVSSNSSNAATPQSKPTSSPTIEPTPVITPTPNYSTISKDDLKGIWVSADSIGIAIFNFTDDFLVVTFGDGKEDARNVLYNYEIEGEKIIAAILGSNDKTIYNVSFSDNQNILHIDGVSFERKDVATTSPIPIPTSTPAPLNHPASMTNQEKKQAELILNISEKTLDATLEIIVNSIGAMRSANGGASGYITSEEIKKITTLASEQMVGVNNEYKSFMGEFKPSQTSSAEYIEIYDILYDGVTNGLESSAAFIRVSGIAGLNDAQSSLRQLDSDLIYVGIKLGLY